MPDTLLTLKDGTQIDVNTGRPPQAVARDAPRSTLATPEVSTKRFIADCPVDKRTLAAILAVGSFELCGFNDDDTCSALGIDLARLQSARDHPEYRRVIDMLVEGAHEYRRSDVESMFAAHAPAAAGVLIDSIGSDDPAIRFAGANGVLDRAGYRRSGDRDRGAMAGTLRVEIIDKRGRGDIAPLDIKIGD